MLLGTRPGPCAEGSVQALRQVNLTVWCGSALSWPGPTRHGWFWSSHCILAEAITFGLRWLAGGLKPAHRNGS